ncbi:toxin-antitoxin system toxin RelE/ParE family protein [Rhizobium sp. CIAT894]|uniref:type II toxin-antitoxin system RelE/ParE family toxin n=1 Tax=Rhizobium sp. CIAT894 TaxID=2020312 RepID=UPI0001908CE8|nr:type II toxin-antitoxin system RelE/ParE family toxin [Rhizobium sp. CIAT894]ARM86830.1 toxin-antitoxin system toxin RelE/ParE family protein [Rhizobium sp. CIAT894]
MKFVFLPEAEDDIERLYGFLIGQANPLAAQKAMLAIDEGIQMLLENPHIGIRMEDRPHYRQLFVPFGRSAYVLRYRLDEETDRLVVVRVWHGRENRI